MQKLCVLIVLVCAQLSCGGGDAGETVKTARVTFFNGSSYRVKVHRDAFSGPVEAELNAGQSKTANVSISYDTDFGTTYFFEYLYRIDNAFDAGSGEVFASMQDSAVQINFIIEEGRSYTKQIPQPANLKPRSSFLEVLNVHTSLCEVWRSGRSILKQAGNGKVPIDPGKTGVYKLDGIPAAGVLYRGYTVFSNSTEKPIPDFMVQNGCIYRFTYNGSSVTQTGSQSIVFH